MGGLEREQVPTVKPSGKHSESDGGNCSSRGWVGKKMFLSGPSPGDSKKLSV